MNLKYFIKTEYSSIKDSQNIFQFPSDFIDFFNSTNGELNFFRLKPEEVNNIGLGLEVENRICMFGGTLSIKELKQEIEFNLKSTGLLKFANNVMNEGGYYIGVGKSNMGKVFYYGNYLEWANEDEILHLSNSFKDFIEMLKPVGVVFNDLGVEYKFLYEVHDSHGNLISLSIKPFV